MWYVTSTSTRALPIRQSSLVVRYVKLHRRLLAVFAS